MTLEDAGSSYGTWLDGHRVNGPTPLHDGSRIRVGNQELVVERRRDESEAGGARSSLPAGRVAPRATSTRTRACDPGTR